MQYRLLYVGRRAADALCQAADAYQARLARYVPIEAVVIRDHGDRLQQGRRLRAQLQADRPTLWVALDERGAQHSTAELAEQLAGWQRDGMRQVAFVIGGADGLDPELRAAAPRCWALSRLTLPHRLARLLLTEQLYRAHSLLRGEPYHRQ